MTDKAIMLLPEQLDIPGKAGKTFTHGFHQYTASFHPELVDIYLKQLGWEGCKVLDPFSGGGTTITEAVRMGMNGYGIDLNPVAVFLGRVKTTKILDIEEIATVFFDEFVELQSQYGFGLFSQLSRNPGDEKNIKGEMHRLEPVHQYFQPDRFEALVRIKILIEEFSAHSWCTPDFHNFLKCCLSSILRNCSKLDPSTHEYYILKERIGDEPWSAFGSQFQYMVRAMKELNACKGVAEVKQGSNLHLPWPDNFFNLVITSPPYGEAVPYNKVFRLTTNFLKMDVKRFQKEEIGYRETNMPERMIPYIHSKEAVTTLQKLMAKAKAGDARSKTLERKMSMYFRDTDVVWSELGRVVKRTSGLVCWIVGNNTFWKHEEGPRYGFAHPTGEKIDNVKIACELAEHYGFTVRKVSLIKGYALTKIVDESAVLAERND